TITQPSAIVLTETNVDVLCNGAATGTIDLMVSGGTGGYMYSWTGGATTQDRSGLAAGTYTVTVTDANGCTKTTSATITQPSAIVLTETNVDVLCNGAATGTIDLMVSGGTGGYIYSWTGGATTQDRSGLAAGTYTVTVTDANICTKTTSATITEPVLLAATATPTNVICNSDGTITLTITGGISPYDITWDGPAANDGTANNQASGYMISSLPAGTYAISVTDENGCIKTASATITEPGVVAVTATPTNVLCNGGSGKVTLTITGGTAPYDIIWDGPAANDGTANNQASGYMISSLPAGTYAISVTDDNGCIKTASATITEPAVLAATATPTNVLCNGGSGKVTLTITGGTAPYDITWDGPAANDGTANNQASGYMISSLPAGTYAISVTDENGCIKTASATITEPAVLAATATPTNVFCNGGSGKVTLTITGGTAPYDITWDGPAANDGTANNQASGYMISSLPAGTYAISVTDDNGCIKTASATITEPAVLAATATPTNVLCNGGSGKVTLTITGGTAPYDITWDGPAANDGTANNQASGYMISSLPAGTYAISVTDDNGCIKTASATI
ncbi:MAG: SprB repeat-containing protein, partial [Saprospiraceae bacterium]|nr:SprB repeat-containing protein [Saprospiraceae bacterium]